MSSSSHACIVLAAALFAISALPARLEAQYIDPGSASVLWQLILAGAFGVAFSLRRQLLYVGRWFLGLFRKSRDE